MSNCRFSDGDFSCDLYCYESDEGYMTYVASNRIVTKKQLPPPVRLTKSNRSIVKWLSRNRKVNKIIRRAQSIKIGGPHDGKFFCDSSIEEFKERVNICYLN